MKLLSANQQNDYEQFFDAHNFIKLFNQNNHANINTSNNYDNSPNPNMHGLIILEYDHNVTPHELIYKIYQLLTIFYKINASCDLLLLGANIQLDTLIINTIQQIKMIKQVFIIDHASLENIIIDNIAIQLAEFIIDNNYQHIISNTNSVANNLFPRLGGILGSDTLTDVTDIVNYNTFRRFIYAANIIATIELLSPYKLLTVNTTIIDLEKFYNNHNSNDNINNIDYDNKTINNIIKKINYIALNYHDNKHIKFIKKSYTNTKINLYNTDLNSAKLIVSGGASLQSKENFNNIIVNFAHQIHAAVGATRAAVEAGLISNEHQVGQTGKKVAPDVYLAVGISGAVQHLSRSKSYTFST